MPTFKITFAYDGTSYVGWQRQAAGVSVQGIIEDALGDLDGRPVPVAGAGRTDAGVHALGQVASCSLERQIEPAVVLRALNARLPADVRALTAEPVAADFHARFDARRKTYRYRIWRADVMNPFERWFAWHITGPLDVGAMDAAARVLEGRHDFAAFRTAGGDIKTTERTIVQSRVSARTVPVHEGTQKTGELITYEISGDGFLRHMVRAIAGTLVEIGRGRWTSDRMRDILASRDRAHAGVTAPPEGLFLVSVEYGDL